MEDVNRWQVVRAVFWHPWARLVGAAWAVFGVLDVFDSRFVASLPQTSGFRRLWDQVFILPSLSWQTWLTGLSVIVAIVAVHGAYRFALMYVPTGAEAARRNVVIAALGKLNANEQRVLRELAILGSADAPELHRRLFPADGHRFPNASIVNDMILRISAETPFLEVRQKHNGFAIHGIKATFKEELDRWVAQPETFS